jgi:hypothetical protein
MSMATASGGARDYLKWAFFALMAACVLLVIWVDERFLVMPKDPEWAHIAKFKWWLLPHGLCGATALCIGPFQFSDRLRKARPRLHRWMGRVYIAAVTIGGAFGMYVGANYEPKTIFIEQFFQAGLWAFTAWMALVSILNRQTNAHKLWMMRSYGFCLVFVLSRVPDAFISHYSDQFLADMLWSLVIAALVVPDLILQARELGRLSAKRRAKQVGDKPAMAAAE